jgi:hypothetical protein
MMHTGECHGVRLGLSMGRRNQRARNITHNINIGSSALARQGGRGGACWTSFWSLAESTSISGMLTSSTHRVSALAATVAACSTAATATSAVGFDEQHGRFILDDCCQS